MHERMRERVQAWTRIVWTAHVHGMKLVMCVCTHIPSFTATKSRKYRDLVAISSNILRNIIIILRGWSLLKSRQQAPTMPPLVVGRFKRGAVHGIVYALIASHEMNTKLNTPHCLPFEAPVTSYTVTRGNRPARSAVSKQEQAIDWSCSRERRRACWPPSVAQHHDIPRTAVLEREFTHFRVAEEVGVAHKFLDRPCVCRTHAA